ncbi:hypothetical protein JXA12_03375 [Candidatus Woesearchaeota archaeon]|nr:hypothetical protein [Candidatus Woesearchaeota archaeon]
MAIDDIIRVDGGSQSMIGRIASIRKMGKNLAFVQLENHHGALQAVVVNPRAYGLNKGSVIRVSGTVVKNDDVTSGTPGYELQADVVELLSKNHDKYNNPNDVLLDKSSQIDRRHLYLRNPSVRNIFEAKSLFMKTCRSVLDYYGFLEVQSPTVVGESVEGPVTAFGVDYYGKDAFLTLSNMLYHEMLMAGDFEKVYEMRTLFRQDKSKTSVHLSEFTILDYTAANHSRNDLMGITEEIVQASASQLQRKGFSLGVEPKTPFPVVTYSEVIGYLNEQGADIVWGSTHQLPKQYSSLLERRFPSFFWLIDQPEASKAFFTSAREEDGRMVCNDFQLWYAKNTNLADGSERVVEKEDVIAKMVDRGMDPRHFSHYLSSLDGLYPNAGVGLGVERTFMTLMGLDNIKDVMLFPRNMKTLYP